MPKANWKNTPLGNLLIIGLAVVAVLALIWFVRGMGTPRETPEGNSLGEGGAVTPLSTSDSSRQTPQIGELAPAFRAQTLGGDELAAPAKDGKPTWVIFNAT